LNPVTINMKSFPLTIEQIIQKLESFCSYRERCKAEVKQKLYQLKADEQDYDFYLNHLTVNNFLDETRFSYAFVRGKNSIKKWGRKKIEMELKAKKIDVEKIRDSIGQIDDGVYAVRLEDLLRKKLNTIKETDPYKRRQKLVVYALQKGYEPEIVNEVLKDVLTD